jgi:hypothetical protein
MTVCLLYQLAALTDVPTGIRDRFTMVTSAVRGWCQHREVRTWLWRRLRRPRSGRATKLAGFVFRGGVHGVVLVQEADVVALRSRVTCRP